MPRGSLVSLPHKTLLRSLSVPIIQAPMAGGPNTPELVAAVADAGGIGSFGFSYATAKRISADLRAVHEMRRLRNGGVNANFFIFSDVKPPSSDDVGRIFSSLNTLPASKPFVLEPPYFLDLSEQLEAIWENPPEVLTFHFGIPPSGVIARAQALGIQVGITATCDAEAKQIVASGVDFIVAQGIEAGGHRGIFDPATSDEGLHTIQLVQRLREVVTIPLVAAGGTMNAHDVAAVLRAGAVAAQMGTAFLTCDESGTSAVHREWLTTHVMRGTSLTSSFSGRPARSIVNSFMTEMARKPYLPFPLQYMATAHVRKAAAERGDGEYQALWAGVNFGQCRKLSASKMVKAIMAELASETSPKCSKL